MAHENGTATAGGAPPGNSNAIRHGLTCAALPKGAGHVRVVTLNLRREIENAIMEARGEVSLYDACIVQTAVRWERVALLASLWLRREAMLTPDQRLNFSREVARASGERDKCLRLLGLHAKERQGAIDALYGPVIDAPDVEAAHASPDATPDASTSAPDSEAVQDAFDAPGEAVESHEQDDASDEGTP